MKKVKRWLSVLLVWCLTVGLVPFTAMAAEPTVQFAGGDGTEENPYQIATAEQLNMIRFNMAANYELSGDIDATQLGSWTPVGTNTEPFTGVFNGNGFSISGMTIGTIIDNGKQYSGLFAVTDGCTLENLELVKETVDFCGNADVITTFSGGLIASNLSENVTVINCKILLEKYCHKTTSTSGSTVAYIGGILGNSDSPSTFIIDSSVSGIVDSYISATYSKARAYQGGAIGKCNSLVVESFSYSGKIHNESNEWANSCWLGGIAGCCSELTIEECFMNVDITGESPVLSEPYADNSTIRYTGGIAGQTGTFKVSKATVDGDIISYSEYGDNHTGGLIGQGGSYQNNSLSSCSFGGAIKGKAIRSYSKAYMGGFVG